ncbi:MAG: hypothetical protein AAGJ40_19660 [Planctomycetota bacterium]
MMRRSWVMGLSLIALGGSFGCSRAVESVAVESASGVTAEEATPRKTLGKTTQKVLALEAAMADGGVLGDGPSDSGNPLMQSAGAYRKSVSNIASMQVTKAIQLRNAQSIKRPRPLTHQEFMNDIMQPGQPNGMRLPMLPYYQEYAWDQTAQELVVVSFPARQAEREKNR